MEATPTISFNEIKAMFEDAAKKAVDSAKVLSPQKD